jgi:hypothetical protein
MDLAVGCGGGRHVEEALTVVFPAVVVIVEEKMVPLLDLQAYLNLE